MYLCIHVCVGVLPNPTLSSDMCKSTNALSISVISDHHLLEFLHIIILVFAAWAAFAILAASGRNKRNSNYAQDSLRINQSHNFLHHTPCELDVSPIKHGGSASRRAALYGLLLQA